MAHNIYMQNGRASLVYYGEKPWHGLGQEIDRPATAAEALAKAMLDYDVVKQPVYACFGKTTRTVPNRFALVRRDLVSHKNCPIYGVVGRTYTPLQNRDAFKFFDPIVGEGAAIYHTAGALGEGETVWILAKLPGEIRVSSEDIVEKYLLLSNSHNGRTSVQVRFTPVRVVCQNTLTMALKRGSVISIRHTGKIVKKLQDEQQILGIAQKGFDKFEKIYKRMIEYRIDSNGLSNYLHAVFPNPKDPKNRLARETAENHRRWSQHFVSEGQGNQVPGVAGTMWAAYNGVTEYVDHYRNDKT